MNGIWVRAGMLGAGAVLACTAGLAGAQVAVSGSPEAGTPGVSVDMSVLDALGPPRHTSILPRTGPPVAPPFNPPVDRATAAPRPVSPVAAEILPPPGVTSPGATSPGATLPGAPRPVPPLVATAESRPAPATPRLAPPPAAPLPSDRVIGLQPAPATAPRSRLELPLPAPDSIPRSRLNLPGLPPVEPAPATAPPMPRVLEPPAPVLPIPEIADRPRPGPGDNAGDNMAAGTMAAGTGAAGTGAAGTGAADMSTVPETPPLPALTPLLSPAPALPPLPEAPSLAAMPQSPPDRPVLPAPEPPAAAPVFQTVDDPFPPQPAAPARPDDTAAQTATLPAMSDPPAISDPDKTSPAPGPMLRVRFEPGSARLPDSGEPPLQALAAQLAARPDSMVQLRAYAGEAGGGSAEAATGARRLSLSRALAVRSFLIEQGVRSTRMAVRALGSQYEDEPADRVDIVLVRP